MKIPFFQVRSAALPLAAALFLLPAASAQISHGGQPEGLARIFPTAPPLVVVPPPDVARYLAEDEDRGHKPLRYGALVDLELTVEDGAFAELPDGSRVWHVSILSPGAKSLALEFAALELPPGARMYIYNAEIETVLGAYIDENVHPDGDFVFEPLPGELMTVEIGLPEDAPDPALTTRALIYDYRDVYGLMDGSVTVGGDGEDGSFLGSCLIDVNCPEGAPWGFQKRATMRTLSGGSLCSGALMNNTANDESRFVLTADHCGQGSSTVFRFRYERSGCGTGSAPTTMSVSGATVLASNGTMDNRLMRITSTIPSSYQPYYAGWTRATTNATYAFAMGHPGGGPKKISIDGNGTTRETNYWRVTWSAGTLEGGSSGGPLFDQNGRVRGPACCVNAFNCSQTAWFGRFDRFWTTNNIGQWLDPLGTNPQTLDGLDPQDPPPPPCTGSATNYCQTSPNSVGPGATITSTGSTSVADNEFVLLAFGLPPNQNAIFYYGESAALVPFGNGWRCVGAGVVGIFRLPIVQADSFGDLFYPLDFTVPPASSGPGLIEGGSVWKFQAWYRDPAGGGSGFNLSDGLDVTFCP